jgi:VWFA-related protein
VVDTAQSAPRYHAYIFDDRSTSPANWVPLQRAAAKHFGELADGERAAIYTFSGQTTVDFTNDKAKLVEAVTALRVRVSRGHGELNACPEVNYYLADLIVNAGDSLALAAVTRNVLECTPSEKNPEFVAQSAAAKEVFIGAQDTRIALDTLRMVIRRMAEIPGERTIVLASPGFFSRTSDERIALENLLNLVAQNGVIISTLDVRGVITTRHSDAGSGLAPARAPRADKLSRLPPLSATATSIPQPVDLQAEYFRQSAIASGDVLEELAKGAGGAYCHGTNDLASCFERTALAPEVRYVIGFSPSEVNASFHPLVVRVNRAHVTIQARRGYFAAYPDKPSADAQIHDAVFSRDEMADFPVDVAAQVSKSGSADAELRIAAEIRAECLHFKKADGKNHDSLTMVFALFDDQGDYIQGSTKSVDFALPDAETRSVLSTHSDLQNETRHLSGKSGCS